MADSKEHYPLNHKGLCLIFNNVEFKRQSKRSGSNKDARDIEEVFRDLGFSVCIFQDSTASDIRSQLINMHDDHYKRYHYVIVFFLTHGYNDGIYGIDETCISFNEIQMYLIAANCPALEGRPKVLIFQCCRAEQRGDGSNPFAEMEEHFLLVFATQPNTVADRTTEEGSFYIQSLLEAIREEAHSSDIFKILTKAAGLLKSRRLYQRSQVCSMLVKDLYLSRQALQANQSCLHEEEESEQDDSSLVCGGALSSWEYIYHPPLEEQDNLEATHYSPAPSSITSPHKPKSYNCSLCIIINNSSSCTLLETNDLKSILAARYGYAVLMFSNIRLRSIQCLLRAVTENYSFNSFMLYVLSQGKHNLVYDSTNRAIPMENIISCLAGPTNTLNSTPKFIYFQTSSNSGRATDEETPSQLTGFTLPDHSICCHVSTESSFIPCLVQTLNRTADIGHLPLRQLLESAITESNRITAERNATTNTMEIDATAEFDVVQPFERSHIYKGSLALAVQVKLTIGQDMKRRETDWNREMKNFAFRCQYESHGCEPVVLNSYISKDFLTSGRNLEDQLLDNVKHIIAFLQENISTDRAGREVLERVKEFPDRYEQYTLEPIDRDMTAQPQCNPSELIQAYVQNMESLLDDTHSMGRDIQQLLVREEGEEPNHCEAARD